MGWTDLNLIGTVWTTPNSTWIDRNTLNLIEFELHRTGLNLTEPDWIGLNQSKPDIVDLNRFELIQNTPNQFEPIPTSLN